MTTDTHCQVVGPRGRPPLQTQWTSVLATPWTWTYPSPRFRAWTSAAPSLSLWSSFPPAAHKSRWHVYPSTSWLMMELMMSVFGSVYRLVSSALRAPLFFVTRLIRTWRRGALEPDTSVEMGGSCGGFQQRNAHSGGNVEHERGLFVSCEDFSLWSAPGAARHGRIWCSDVIIHTHQNI